MASAAINLDDTQSFSIGRVLGRASGTVARNPVVTIGMAFVLGAIPGLFLSWLFFGATSVGLTDQLSENAALGAFTVGLAVALLTIAVTLVVQGALIRAVVADSDGQRAGFAECLTVGIRAFLPLLGLIILSYLAMSVGLVLLIIPGIIVILMLSVASPALVEERVGVIGAIKRSRTLTKDNRWKILGVLVIMTIAYLLLAGGMQAVGLTAIDSFDTGEKPVFSFAVIVGTLIPSTLATVAWGTIQPSIYVELRNLKESGSAGNLREVFA